MYDLVNIFSIFLPQLLMYPNPKDPLNSEAARLLMKDEAEYNVKVKDYVKRFASAELMSGIPVRKGDSEKHKPARDDLSETSQVAVSSDSEDDLISEM
jgi:ubiquitin-conjugating enzyme E2 H